MLVSLERRAGLPLALDPRTATLRWPDGISVGEVSERTLAELAPFLADAAARAERVVIYTVYRNMARREDLDRIRASRLRYDITVIPPGSFAGATREFFRTAGHYHASDPKSAVPYPEVYEVISGRAYWLLQRPARLLAGPARLPAGQAGGPRPGDPATLGEIYAVEAGPGEKAVMLPGFGHLTANAFDEPLVMANWIRDDFAYDYGPYRALRGGGYRIICGSVPDTIEFEENGNYREVPELVKLRPREVPGLGLTRSRPLYALSGELEQLRFLCEPAAFASTLTLEHCYRAI